MQFNILDNGIDSLKASGDILLEYYSDHEFERHQIKDAVFHFMHSVEILSKYLLQEQSERHLFKDFKEYQKAQMTMDEQGLKSVFDVNPNIRTIDVMTALTRLTNQTKIKINDNLYNSLDEIRIFRNLLTHYTVNLDDDEFVTFVNLLRRTFEETLFLFEANIPDFKIKFNGIQRDGPLTDYDNYLDELANAAMVAHEEARLDYEADMMDALESQGIKGNN